MTAAGSLTFTYRPTNSLLEVYGYPFALALVNAGHTLNLNEEVARDHVYLTDDDRPCRPEVDLFDRVMLHPHGGGIVAWGSGQWPRHPNTIGQFVVGPGRVEIAQASGDVPAIGVGWPWCEQRAFRPMADAPARVYFAPSHPCLNGWIHPALGEASHARVMVDVLDQCAPDPEVRVSRDARTLAGTLVDLDWAELVVVNHGSTVHTLAVARGVPTVVYGDGVEAYTDYDDMLDVLHPPAPRLLPVLQALTHYRWHTYDVAEAMQKEDTDWRDRFVGENFDPVATAAAFDRLVAA